MTVLRRFVRAQERQGRTPDQSGVESATPQSPVYVCFSGQDWWYHNHAHSDFQLMRRIARDRDVLFINSIGMRMPMPGRSTYPLRRVLRKVRSISRLIRRPIADEPRFVVFTPLVIPFYQWAFARSVNARLVRLQLKLMLRRYPKREAAYVVTIPTAWDVIAPMPRHTLVYNRSDKQSAFEETNQAVIRSLEDRLLLASDHVLYVSHRLMDAECEKTSNRAFFLDHGVDAVHFTRRTDDEIPADIRAIPRPRIGFFGGIDDYVVDLDLLEHIACSMPDAQLVLIGHATCSMERFAKFPNVHHLGYRPYSEIPAYGSGFDVGLMPWLANDWIEHANPIKLKEYLALGLPVVTTDFPEARFYREHIRIAEDGDGVAREIRNALTEFDLPADERSRRRAERRHAVEFVTWDSRAELLRTLVEGGKS